jgi:hypothetical protein
MSFQSPSREPRDDVTAAGPQAALVIRYARCMGRVLGEALMASDHCAGYVPPLWPVIRQKQGRSDSGS